MTFGEIGRTLVVLGIGFMLGQGSRESGVTTAHVVSGGMRVASDVYGQFQAAPAEAAPSKAVFIPVLNPEREETEVVHERRPRRG